MTDNEYTPSISDMKEMYVIGRATGDPGSLPFGNSGEAEARAEFDRSLTAHDAQVHEQAITPTARRHWEWATRNRVSPSTFGGCIC
jgi:hypothetical protein